MIIHSENEMIEFGRKFAGELRLPAVIELVGDVGTGKTTFTRGLAEGLGVQEPVTSPSFTISKRYAFRLPGKCCKNYNINATSPAQVGELVHYDFYRLDDPGIMRDELAETLAEPNVVAVIEWGGDVADLLPPSKYHFELTLQADGSRRLEITYPEESRA